MRKTINRFAAITALAALFVTTYESVAESDTADSLPIQPAVASSAGGGYVTATGHDRVPEWRAALSKIFTTANTGDLDQFMRIAAVPYIQHSPDYPEGWLPVWDSVTNRAPGFSSEPIRMMGEGNYLVMLRRVVRDPNQPAIKIVDILRFDDDGLYAEHWDIQQPLAEQTASGRGELDEASVFTDQPVAYDLIDEARNKAIVVDFLDTAFNQGRLAEALEKYVAEDYVQHNPLIPDGRQPVLDAFAAGKIPPLQYDIQQVFAENDMVVVFSRVTSELGTSAVVDFIRVRDGVMVEHWDVVQPVPPAVTFRHDNGMF